MNVISILLFSSVLIGSWFTDTARLRQKIPNWFLNCLALAYLPILAIDYRLLSHSFTAALLHLLLFTASVKLVTLSKDRDFLMLYLISFAELLAASALTVDFAYILCFLMFLFSGISTLILFEMRRSNARMQGEGRVQPLVMPKKLQGTGLELFSPFPAGPVSAAVVVITLLVIAGAIPLFFLLPRITLGLYSHPSGQTRLISGFSDRVELGQIGTIKQSDATVMRVKTDKQPSELPPDLKWRGLAFDYYDGRSWRRSDDTRYPVSNQGWYYRLESVAQSADWIHQTFFIEALSTDVIFAAHKVLAVSRDVGLLQRDSAKSLYAARQLNEKLRYSAVSDPVRSEPSEAFDRLPIPQDILDKYLQLPPMDPRIEDLAGQVTKSAKGRYAKAQALERYLRTHYTYSLVLRGNPHSKDPLAMFLFDIREGHCEYFASAMTVMLRQIGIPARLVNGFRAGEYNSIGDNWIVRQYNAHSWVEAYFPPHGWIEFDPTPPDPPHSRTAIMRLISDLGDAVDLWWWESIVNYDTQKYSRVLGALYNAINDTQKHIRDFLAHAAEKGRLAAARLRSPGVLFSSGGEWGIWIACITVVALLAIKHLRRRILGLMMRKIRQSDSRAVAVSFYREALDLLNARGLKRGRDQTPMEFALRLGNHPAGNPFLALTRMYNAARFGRPGIPLRQGKAEALLRALRRALRHSSKKSNSV